MEGREGRSSSCGDSRMHALKCGAFTREGEESTTEGVRRKRGKS